jgi:TolB-like protein/DNA-binding winged helix-turn-helix (wHTH) protein/cytochrome c-type biogenesis protein CcmH/NrfG
MNGKAIYRLGDLTIDVGRGRVSRGQDEIALPKLSFDLLLALVRAAPNLVSFDELLAQVWPGLVVSPETITYRVKALRDALGDDAKAPRYIVGLRGRGYQVAQPVEQVATPVERVALPVERAADAPPTPATPEAHPPATPEAHPPSAPEVRSPLAPELQPPLATLPSVPPRRRYIGLAVAGVAMLALAVVAGVWWQTARHSRSTLEAAQQKSIAILPFTDLSEKQDQAYFAEGMTEEIRNLLVTVPKLRVIGRTSSFQFKGGTANVRKIGSTLGAAYIVEGSVRRSGDQVRVVAQLIDARDGTQRWSQTFDRNVTDILRIQQEIATAAARALQLEVAFVSANGVAHNSEAYDHYLHGLHAGERFDQQGFEEALSHFQRALELDPTMVDAAVALAETLSQMAAWGYVDAAPGWERTRVAAEAALKLDPKSARAHAVLGDRYLEYEWNWAAAQRELQLAFELAPHDPTVLGQLAQGRVVMGHPEEALQYLDTALTIDPLDPNRYFARNWSYLRLGRFAEGEVSARRALDLAPTYSGGRYFLSLALLLQGKAAEALAEAQKETEPGSQIVGEALAYHALGRAQEADAALARLEKEHSEYFAMYIAEVYAFRGDKDHAFEWLERAYAQRDMSLFFIKQEILLLPLQDDPRYRALLHKMNLPL